MPEHTPHGPEDTNSNPVSEQVRHSGHQGERPVYEFRNPDGSHMSIEEAMAAGLIHPVPNTLGEHRDPSNTPPTEAYTPLHEQVTTPVVNRRKRLAAVAAGVVGTAVIGGIGAVMAVGGDSEKPTPKSDRETSAPVNPTPEQTPETSPTLEQVQREGLSFETHYLDLIDEDMLYEDPLNAANYVDQAALATVVGGILNNITYTTETGNEDGLRAALLQERPGYYGNNQDMVDAIMATAAQKREFQEENPSYPVSNIELERIESVQPDIASPDVMTVTATVVRHDYGANIPGVAVEDITTRETWTLDLKREKSVGWEDGSTRLTWLASDWVILQSEAVSN